MHGHDMSQPWFTQWSWNPVILVGIVVLTGLYCYGVIFLRRNYQAEEHARRGQIIAFAIAIVMLFAALISPLDMLAEMLFTGHMIQHLILSLVVSPLLVLAIPPKLATLLLKPRSIALGWKWLVMPLISGILFNANIWVWHAPPIMNAMMESDGLHLLAMVLYVVTGFLFWWPLFGPVQNGVFPLNMAGKMIYILLGDMPMVLLGAGLTFTYPLYATYAMTSRMLGLSPALDQQIGGLLMWIPGAIFMIVVASILFLRWMLKQEARQKEEDRRLAELELADDPA
jgi:cytochrome c oxidase assembly factor CtaG